MREANRYLLRQEILSVHENHFSHYEIDIIQDVLLFGASQALGLRQSQKKKKNSSDLFNHMIYVCSYTDMLMW